MTADRIVEELVSNQATTLCRPGFNSIPGGRSLASGHGSPGSGSLWPADADYSSLKDRRYWKKKTLSNGFD